MAYTEHDKWADDLCESDDVTSPLIAEMISDRLNAQADEIERLRRHRRYLNAVAIWFASNEPEVLEPDWVDPQGWSNCEPMIDEESVDECERLGWNIEATEEGGEKP